LCDVVHVGQVVMN